ncbi:hypothetical protein [Pelagibacterium halotolerans]|uniref:hypothetical protein n=1 Tax=Pelagibacterium halotolerans TaxID=531813 RepID=UPI00384C5ED0
MARKGNQGRHLRGMGLYTGGNWPEYRYGKPEPRPVHNPAKPAKRRIVKDSRREKQLIGAAAEQLRNWDSTPFEFEASCRHGLRQSFCEDGHAWQRSDDEAAHIVHEALLSIGAKRPDWAEGQWEYAISPDYCVGCGGPMPDEEMAKGHRFCSPDCARGAYERRSYGEIRKQSEIARNAYHIIRTDRAPTATCQHCQKPFKRAGITEKQKTESGKGKFCSVACHNASMRIFADRECTVCGKTFRPKTETQHLCSKACVTKHQVKPLNATCKCCGKPFKSYRVNSAKPEKYCSVDCARSDQWNRQIPKSCAWCGDGYFAKSPKSTYCTPRCRQLAINYRNGQIPERISRPVFDHFFTLPTNAMRPAQLTPSSLDKLLEAA